MSIYFYFYEDELLYIGSTFDMKARIGIHKSRLKYNSTIKFYKYLRENNLTFDNLEMEEVETEITDDLQLKILEQNCQDLYEPICNMIKAYLSEEDKKQYQKEYKKTDKYIEYQKEYQKEYNKSEKCKEYENTDKRKEAKKEYNKTNKFKEYQKQYEKK